MAATPNPDNTASPGEPNKVSLGKGSGPAWDLLLLWRGRAWAPMLAGCRL